MKVSEILNQVDNGFIALPVFQRGYVWGRDQVRQLFTSMYRSYPVGSLLMWGTQSDTVEVRGDLVPAVSPVKMLLDGQQRITSLYGVIRGVPPPFFDGNRRAFEELHFNVQSQAFAFYSQSTMKSDAKWIDVSLLMQADEEELLPFAAAAAGEEKALLSSYYGRLAQLRRIRERDLHDDMIDVEDQSVDVIVDIFNRVNSGGTKLSAGDLALSRVCAKWPEARDEMKNHLAHWRRQGHEKFDLVWLLRCVNTVLTGRASFDALSGRSKDEIQDGLKRAVVAIDRLLNLLSDRFGLDHGKVLTGHNSLAVMARYVDSKSGKLSLNEENRLLYWYLASAIRSRFSGSPETTMQNDLAAMEPPDGDLDSLIHQLYLTTGEITIEPGHFDTAQTNSRFYPVIYLLTRMSQARDFCSGLELKEHLHGKQSRLQLHHIFPKSRLRKRYHKRDVNAVANFCFLTADCNGAKNIGNKLPEEYFPDVESSHPGVLASQWIPKGEEPWTLERYPEFLEKRRGLLAAATNQILESLRNGSLPLPHLAAIGDVEEVDDETAELEQLRDWLEGHNLASGELGYELADAAGSERLTIVDLAWPEGVQTELSEAVAVLLNEPQEVVASASSEGFRCFTSTTAFRKYVESEVLVEDQEIMEAALSHAAQDVT